MNLDKDNFRAYRLYIDYLGTKGSLNHHVEPICAVDYEDASQQADDISTHFSKGTVLHVTLKDHSKG